MNSYVITTRSCLVHQNYLKLSVRLLASNTKIQRDEEDSLPKITFPHKMVAQLNQNKDNKKEKRWQMKRKLSKPQGPLIISCKRKSYNFHKYEHFDESDFSKLVSLGWKNTKRVGDTFTLLPHSENPSIIHDNVTFEDTGLSKDLSSALHCLGFEYPTNIQKTVIPSLLQGDNVICAAETGSGKTLAYLLPVIDRLLQQKQFLSQRQSGLDSPAPGHSPHAVVITPSRELTEQVMEVAQSLSTYVPFKPHCVIGGQYRKLRGSEKHNEPCDILISTSGALNKILISGGISRANLQSIVIDESDTLLDDSFVSDIQQVFHNLQVSPVEAHNSTGKNPFLAGQQIALVSATMPRHLETALGGIIPVESLRKITTNDLHQVLPHVRQTFMRLKPSSKQEKLIQILKKNAEQKKVSLVFTNNNQTCYFVSKLLEANKLQCSWIHGNMVPKEREGVFTKFKEGYCDILVATDIVSRGLDTTNVHHIINYDFPTFMSDYVHRVGRVGRVGVQHVGDVTSFVSTKWDVELLWKIEIAARKQKKLGNVNANIKRALEQRKAKDDVFTMDIA